MSCIEEISLDKDVIDMIISLFKQFGINRANSN